jgi:hypothetical protein
MKGTVYFGDGHTEPIIHFKHYRFFDEDYISFCTESGEYRYESNYETFTSEAGGVRLTPIVMRRHAFLKFNPERLDWFVVNIDRIEISKE